MGPWEDGGGVGGACRNGEMMNARNGSPRQGNCQGRAWEVGMRMWEMEMQVVASASCSLRVHQGESAGVQAYCVLHHGWEGLRLRDTCCFQEKLAPEGCVSFSYYVNSGSRWGQGPSP